MSLKFQITLPDELASDLRATAARQRVSLAQFIRDTMEDKLRDMRRKRTTRPFASIQGIVDSEETDLAARVDEVLYRQ